MEVYPAILESTKKGVAEKVDKVRDLVARVQIDVVDGLFADKITVTPDDLREMEWGQLAVDFHLMVDDPMAWIEECVGFRGVRVIGQIERMGSQAVFVDWAKGYEGVGVGLGVDLHTPIKALEKAVLPQVEAVVLMAVKAGFQGQVFDKRVLAKIEELRKIYAGEVVVDGGVGRREVKLLAERGVEGVAVGSFLWQGKVKENLERLKK